MDGLSQDPPGPADGTIPFRGADRKTCKDLPSGCNAAGWRLHWDGGKSACDNRFVDHEPQVNR